MIESIKLALFRKSVYFSMIDFTIQQTVLLMKSLTTKGRSESVQWSTSIGFHKNADLRIAHSLVNLLELEEKGS